VADYTNDIADAAKDIAAAGCDVQVVSYSDPISYDATKPWRQDDAAETVEDATALIFYEAEGAQSSTVSSDLVHKRERKVYIPAAGLTARPALNGQVRFGDDAWKIEGVETIGPSGVPILYIVELRQ
jgi:hypothetical protein